MRQYASHRADVIHEARHYISPLGMEREEFSKYGVIVEQYSGGKDRFIKMIEDGIEMGLGYENIYTPGEFPLVRIPNLKYYNDNLLAPDDRLYNYCKNNLFLSKEELDYEKIDFEFIGSDK